MNRGSRQTHCGRHYGARRSLGRYGVGRWRFTLALRDIAGPDVEIVAVDTNQGALRLLSDKMRVFPDANLHLLAGTYPRSSNCGA